jgi:hypothetical protein
MLLRAGTDVPCGMLGLTGTAGKHTKDNRKERKGAQRNQISIFDVNQALHQRSHNL